MAEKTILVCDLCGLPAIGVANIRFNGAGQTWQLDLCSKDVAKLKTKGRKPKRGRRAGTFVKEQAPPDTDKML